MVNPKAKGNSWENTVLRDLRSVINVAYKSLGSGNAKDDKGDVLTTRFMIECKHHRSFTDGEIDKYWVKLIRESDAQNKEPILICKENRKEAIVYFWDYFRGTRRVMMHYHSWLEYLKETGEERICCAVSS